MKHIGIAAVTAEGAALTYKYICAESEKHFGEFIHPEISIHSFSFSKHINYGEDRLGKWTQLLIESINKLESIGADFVICPSNTPHEVYEQVTERINIPWINIAESVLKEAERLGVKRVLLLGTEFIFSSSVYPGAFSGSGIELSSVYPGAFSGSGIELLVPEADDQNFIHELIVSALIRGAVTGEYQAKVRKILKKSQCSGVDAVILGCTELPLIIDSSMTDMTVLDSTTILGNAAIESAKK